MKTKSLKLQIGGFLATFLFLAMLLVSLVWGMFYKRTMVEKEIRRLEDALEAVAVTLPGGRRNSEELSPAAAEICHRQGISCFYLQARDGRTVGEGEGKGFPDQIIKEIASETRAKKGKAVAYHGTSWAVFTFSHDQVVVGKPLFDDHGEITGTLIGGASLAPVYARIRQEGAVVVFYIIINTIIFAGIGLLRMMQLVMKPIERLIALSQQYTPSDTLNFLPEATNNEFASLSLSLNNLFGRIREDNEKLRATVALLESANSELARNKQEMVRTEKLAAIGRLSAGLAHEIGNPLAIIMGYIDLLGRTDLSGQERQQFSQNSQLELERIKNLIRQLLDFARPVNVSPGQVSVNALVGEVLSFVGMEKSFAHCAIIEKLDAAWDTVMADADSLRQVLLNCLLNSADSLAGVESQGEIVISTGNLENDLNEQVLYICIGDNGPGIADEHLGNVFDPFFTTKGPGQGTGLGLFVCHTIIERLGGTILIRNRHANGGGAEVLITLPSSESRQTVLS